MSFRSRSRSASITSTWIPQIPPPPKTSPPPPKKNRHRRRQKLRRIRPPSLRAFLRLGNNCEQGLSRSPKSSECDEHHRKCGRSNWYTPSVPLLEVYSLFRKGSHPAGVN